MEERVLSNEHQGNVDCDSKQENEKDEHGQLDQERNSKEEKESFEDNEISQKVMKNDENDTEQNKDDDDDNESVDSSQSSSSSSSSSSASSSSSGEFDFEKIKQKAGQSSSSTLPKWFLETNTSLNTYNEKVKEVTERLSDLGKGLQQFEEKRQDHVNKQKEDRRKYFERKYGGEVKKADETDERFKSPFYSLNQYILQRILELAEGDLISNILKMSRVSRKFLHLATSNEFWQRVSCQYIGRSIVDLNAKHVHHFEKHQGTKQISKSAVAQQVLNQGMYQKWCLHLHTELKVFQISIRNYRQQNCPLVVEHSLRTNLIRGLRIVNEIFSAVAYNQSKNFRLYILLVDFLKDNYLKGSYCLWRLAQTQEENIRYDAFDALFSLLQLEPTEASKLNSLGSISHFLQESFFDMEKKLKALISTELSQILDLLPSRFKESMPHLIMLPSIIYNSRFSLSLANQNVQKHLTHQHYDLQDSAGQIKQIDSILKSLLSSQEGQEGLSFSGYYMQRDNNALQELKGKMQLTKGNTSKGHVSYTIKGYGITSAVMVNQVIQNQRLDEQMSDQEQFQLEGVVTFMHKSVLKNNYEVHNQVSFFASGKLLFQLGAGRPGSHSNMFMHAGFSFPMHSGKKKSSNQNDDNQYVSDFQEDEEIDYNGNQQEQEEESVLATPTFTFYGGSENLREILLIRL